MHYSISFPEWNLPGRLHALKSLGLQVEFNAINNEVDIKSAGGVDALGSAHKEAVKFICDPVYSPIMYNMDFPIGRLVARLYAAFWYWKFKMPYMDIEAMIANSIRHYIADLDCKEQDKWILYTANDLKEQVMQSSREVFSDDFWMVSTIGQYVVRNLSDFVVEESNISWSRIRNLTL